MHTRTNTRGVLIRWASDGSLGSTSSLEGIGRKSRARFIACTTASTELRAASPAEKGRAMNHWKTTTVGVLAALVAVATALIAEWDGTPETKADWGTTLAVVLAAIGLGSAADARRIKPSSLVPLVLLALMVGVLAACGSVGPTREQTIGGVRSTNSPLNGTAIVEEGGSFTAEHSGPLSAITMTADEFRANKPNQVTRDIAYRDPNGRSLTISSGSDLTAKGVRISVGEDQVVSIDEFSTSSSEPIRAANEALDRYADVWKSLSADQRAVIEARVKAIGEAVPEVAEIVARLLVPAP